MVWRLGGAGLFLPLLLCASLAFCAEDVLFSDYFVQTIPTISSATTPAQLQAYANVTHILNGISFQSTFCSNPNFANNTFRYQALVASFSNVREIHGFLSIQLICVPDFAFFRNLVRIRGNTATTSGDVLSLVAGAQTQTSVLRQFGFANLKQVNGNIRVGPRVTTLANPAPGVTGLCGKGNPWLNFSGADLTMLVPGTIIADLNFSTANRTVIIATPDGSNATVTYFVDEANCQSPYCHSSCNGRCWGRNDPSLCQQVCRCNTTAGCPDNDPSTCCPANCSLGCSASGVCKSCAPGYLRNPDDTCQTTCPPGYLRFGYVLSRETCKNFRELAPFTCISSCPTNYYRFNGTCVYACPRGAMPVNGVCPDNPPSLGVECRNVDYVNSPCALQLLSNQSCSVLLGSLHLTKIAIGLIDGPTYDALRRLRYITGYLYAYQIQWLNMRAFENIVEIRGLTALGSGRQVLFVAEVIPNALTLYNLRFLGGLTVLVQDNRYMCFQSRINWLQLFNTTNSSAFTLIMNFTSTTMSATDIDFIRPGSPPLSTWGSFSENPSLCPSLRCDPICGARSCWDSTPFGCQRCPGSLLIVAFNGSCVETCPPGTVVGSLDALNYPSDQSACVPCHPNCLTCSNRSETDCLSCPAGRGLRVDRSCGLCDMSVDGYLLNTTCVLECPFGLYEDTETAACQFCDSNCTACDGTATFCTNCSTGFYLSGGLCLSTCPASTYAVPGVLACQPCASECALCTGPSTTNCQACRAPLSFLLPGSTTCAPAASCPVGTFANEVNQRCDPCGPNCARCVYSNFTSRCLNCTGATFLPPNGVCQAITPCGPSEYIFTPATANIDNVCRSLRTCLPQSEYQLQAPTATSDRVCVSATQCNSSQYELSPPGLVTDRVCAACRVCSGVNETSFNPCRGECRPRDLCNINPCQNNGTCVNNQGWTTSCICPTNFSGDFCEADIRSCLPNPCFNSGNCTPIAGGFTCACPSPFSGTLCTIDLSICSPSPCLNNGTCTAFENREFRCTCRQGFEGVLCGSATAEASSSSALTTGTAVAAGIGLLVLLVLLVMGLRYAARMRRKAQAAKLKASQPCDPLLGDEWEIERPRLIIGRVLGEGQFGQVNQGLYKQPNMPENAPALDVAVKSVKDTASESDRRDFLAEIRLMKDIGRHPHVLSLVGVCSSEPQLLVVEFAECGDLRSYMIERRATANRGALLVAEDMLDFCLQIAHGMEYLAKLMIIHRDLACRNVLVAKHAGTLLLKVSDFGLARDIYEENFYKKTTAGKLPFKWMSPEALTDSMFTTMSDVWSFGVVMWEIHMLGQMPYPGIDPSQLVRLLHRGFRMPCPPVCPDDIYQIMLACWDALPEKRPTFTDLRRQFSIKAGVADVYENAHAGIAYYMTPGVMYSDLAYDGAGGKSLYDNEGGKSNYDNEGGKSLYDNEGGKLLYDNEGGKSLYDNEGRQAPDGADNGDGPAYDNALTTPAGKGGAKRAGARAAAAAAIDEDGPAYDNAITSPASKGTRASVVAEEEQPEHLYDMGTEGAAGKQTAQNGRAAAARAKLVSQRAVQDEDDAETQNAYDNPMPQRPGGAAASAAAARPATAQRANLSDADEPQNAYDNPLPQRDESRGLRGPAAAVAAKQAAVGSDEDPQHLYDNATPQRHSGEHPVPKAIARGIVAAFAEGPREAPPNGLADNPFSESAQPALQENAFYDSARVDTDGYLGDLIDAEEDPQLLVRVLSKRSRESFDLASEQKPVGGLDNPEYAAPQ